MSSFEEAELQYFSGLLATFNTPGASKEDIMTAGENALFACIMASPGKHWIY